MKTRFLVIVLIALIGFSCGQKKKSETNEVAKSAKVEKEKAAPDYSSHPGKMVYNQVCLVCHQSDAMGTPGMHPPLVGTEIIKGDNEKLIDVVLNGLSGEITVLGEVYNNVMPPNTNLTDKQIADVLNYIRLNFNGIDKPVTPEEVAAQRK